LEDPGIDGKVISIWMMWGMDWIVLAQDRDRFWAFVRAVMNLQVP